MFIQTVFCILLGCEGIFHFMIKLLCEFLIELYISSFYSVHYLNAENYKSRYENPQKLTQLSPSSHPRHLVGKRTA